MKVDQIRQLVDQVEFGDYAFAVSEAHGNIYLQATYDEADIVTGVVEKQHTRKWLLSPAMTKSEIVQTCFKLAMTSAEHRVRETFKYRGRRIFGPHFDVDALHRICGDREFDVRPASDELSVTMVLSALLLVADTGATEHTVASWTPEQRQQAYDWAIGTHYQASDNNVVAPQRPKFVPHLSVSGGAA